MTTKHTPGPWVYMPKGSGAPPVCVDGDPDMPIVEVVAGPTHEQIKANAALIAAAPELYQLGEALLMMLKGLDKSVLKHVGEEFHNLKDLQRKVDAILKKARGE